MLHNLSTKSLFFTWSISETKLKNVSGIVSDEKHFLGWFGENAEPIQNPYKIK